MRGLGNKYVQLYKILQPLWRHTIWCSRKLEPVPGSFQSPVKADVPSVAAYIAFSSGL